jgi:hypothetical protein
MKGIIFHIHALCRRLYDDNLALYGKRYYYYVWELPVFVLMGVAAGLLGSAFIKLNIRATQLRARFVPPCKPWLRLLEVPCIYPPCDLSSCIILYHWCHPEERCSDGSASLQNH